MSSDRAFSGASISRSRFRAIQRVSVDRPTPRFSANSRRVRPLVRARRTASSSNFCVNPFCFVIEFTFHPRKTLHFFEASPVAARAFIEMGRKDFGGRFRPCHPGQVILANHIWLERYTACSAPAQKCSVFMNHVDRQIFQPQARATRSGGPLILYPGGLQWHQGLDIATRAFATLKCKLPDARFHIYGDGSSKCQLMALAEELGLNESVTFF